MKLTIYFLALFTFSTVARAEIVQSSPCDSQNEQSTVASINQVRVAPCPAPGDGASQPCKLIRGSSATFSVDFVPKQDVATPKATVYHLEQGHYLPYLGLHRDVCSGLTAGACPLQAGASYTWSAEVKLSHAFPLSTYPIKVKIADGSDENVVICQTFIVELADSAEREHPLN